MDAARTSAVGSAAARAAISASGSCTVARPGSAPSRRTRSASGGDSIVALGGLLVGGRAAIGIGRLDAVQGGVAPVGLQELEVRAALAYPAVLEIQNQVRPGREPQVVRDQESGPSLGQPVQGLDHGALALAVQAGGRSSKMSTGARRIAARAIAI